MYIYIYYVSFIIRVVFFLILRSRRCSSASFPLFFLSFNSLRVCCFVFFVLPFSRPKTFLPCVCLCLPLLRVFFAPTTIELYSYNSVRWWRTTPTTTVGESRGKKNTPNKLHQLIRNSSMQIKSVGSGLRLLGVVLFCSYSCSRCESLFSLLILNPFVLFLILLEFFIFFIYTFLSVVVFFYTYIKFYLVFLCICLFNKKKQSISL